LLGLRRLICILRTDPLVHGDVSSPVRARDADPQQALAGAF
jgi:hypothetical protein